MEIMLFTKWRPSAILNLPKLPFLSRYLYSHFIIHLHCKFRVDQSIWRRDITNITFNMAFVRHLEFLKFQFCVKSPFSEWKSASAYQIWSKSDNSQLHLRTKRLNLKFEISLETWRWDCNLKIAVLVTCPISACDPSSMFQISRLSADMAPRYSQKKIFNVASVRHLGFVMTSSYCIVKLHFTFSTLC